MKAPSLFARLITCASSFLLSLALFPTSGYTSDANTNIDRSSFFPSVEWHRPVLEAYVPSDNSQNILSARLVQEVNYRLFNEMPVVGVSVVTASFIVDDTADYHCCRDRSREELRKIKDSIEQGSTDEVTKKPYGD